MMRSNYFRVNDKDQYKKFLLEYNLGYIEEDYEPDRVGFVGDEVWRLEDDSFFEKLSNHLQLNEIALIMEVGFQKARFGYGWIVAVRSDGEMKKIDLYDIFEFIREEWGSEDITLPEF